MDQLSTPARFVTFYSFKGGVGRSMAVINTAGILASRGFRVLILDLDLEAPGLSYLGPELDRGAESVRASQHCPGFVDLMTDAKERGQDSALFSLPVSELVRRYTQPYPLPADFLKSADGCLDIMPAGSFDGNYAERFDALDLHGLYQEGLGEPLIRAFKKAFAESGLYDYVLVDSRTGFSDEAGICTRDLADYLIVLSGLNRQNIEGTAHFFRELRTATNGSKRFEIILSPVPNGEDALVDSREKAAKRSFEAAWGGEIKLRLQIPYHPQLALTEDPHIFRRRRGYLFDAYRAIERRLLEAMDDTVHVLRQRAMRLIGNHEFVSALEVLRRMVRLDDGSRALTRVAETVSSVYLLHERSWAQQESVLVSAELGSLPRPTFDQNAQPLYGFIVDNVSLEETLRESLSRMFVLEKQYTLLDRLAERLGPRDLARVGALLEHHDADSGKAEVYFSRAAEMAPNDAAVSALYARFLERAGRLDEAEEILRRSMDVPENPSLVIALYARFLAVRRHDLVAAEGLYRKALEHDAPPSDAPENVGLRTAIEADLAQAVIGQGRIEEGLQILQAIVGSPDALESLGSANMAELYLALWLASAICGLDNGEWERRLKGLFQQGFRRHHWSFDEILAQARSKLSGEDAAYAAALVEAFLDKDEMTELAKFARWQGLQPVLPPLRGRRDLAI